MFRPSTGERRSRIRALALGGAAALAIGLVPGLVFASPASAADFTSPDNVLTTFEGCRGSVGSGSYTKIPGTDVYTCDDSEYTTGNLGKGWNELDLVPHRLTLKRQANSSTSSYDIIVAGDNSLGAYEGYDAITDPQVTTGSCTVTASPTATITGITGGTDDAIYRILHISQPSTGTCVIDLDLRLSATSAEFSGSSLQAYIFEAANFSTGKSTVPIPVNDVLPQTIAKDMTAVQDQAYGWLVSKDVTEDASISNTCTASDLSMPVAVTVTWTRTGPSPDGDVLVSAVVSGTNPSKRDVGISVTDVTYNGLFPIDTYTFDPFVLEPGTHVIGTHSFTVSAATLGTFPSLHDEATASYTDLDLDVPIVGTATATDSTSVAVGTTTNASAVVSDVETLTGTGLQYSVESVSAVAGATYGTGSTAPYGTYTLGTKLSPGTTFGWQAPVTSSGSVTFTKKVWATKGLVTTGSLSDVATVDPSDAEPSTADASTPIVVDTLASLTVDKTIPNVLQGSETASFTFDVLDSAAKVVATTTISFTAGETHGTATITGLVPAAYTVRERPATGWLPAADVPVDLSGATCSGVAGFTNSVPPSSARVRKVTVPAGYGDGWTFRLFKGASTTPLETVTTDPTKYDADGYVPFLTKITEEGTYRIEEVLQPGWAFTSKSADCTFTVSLPAPAAVYSCTYTNTVLPAHARVQKVTDPAGYEAGWEFTLKQGTTVVETVTTTGTGYVGFTTDLTAGDYTIVETPKAGWHSTGASPECAFTVAYPADRDRVYSCTYSNAVDPAHARVQKVTVPAGSEAGWEFTLMKGTTVVGTATTTGTGYVGFTTDLTAGDYTIVETMQSGWQFTSKTAECSFTVSYPADRDRLFSCTFTNTKKADVEVLKKTSGAIDPTKDWTFALYSGPHSGTSSSFLSSPIATRSTLGDADGVLTFPQLDPTKTYTMCELGVPVGWTASWTILGVPVTGTYNPNATDNPAQNLGNTCLDFTVSPGATLQIVVDNQPPPGGGQRTIGYWKNWSTCTAGGQVKTAEKNGGWAAGYWLIDDVLTHGGILLGNYQVPDCQAAVDLLSKRPVGATKPKASDPIFNMVAQLVAAKANVTAGAGVCGIDTTIAAADSLLVKYSFAGTGYSPALTSADRTLANQLATTLDQYNNGLLC